MDFIKKIQSQPENVRRMIFWVSLVVAGLVLFAIWIFISLRAIKGLTESNLLEKMNVSGLKSDVDKSVGDIKEKAASVEDLKQKAEDILNDEELEKLIEEEEKQLK